MIRLASDLSSEFQPYAKTNQELTKAVKTLDDTKFSLTATQLGPSNDLDTIFSTGVYFWYEVPTHGPSSYSTMLVIGSTSPLYGTIQLCAAFSGGLRYRVYNPDVGEGWGGWQLIQIQGS